MRKNRLFSIFVIVLFILVACRKEEPLPTAVPTIIVPTVPPTSTPIATESGTETAVATPAPVQIDPADIDWAPQVLYSSPAPGEDVLLDGAITIRFDQPMNQTAVEAAFTVTPEDSSQKVTGNFSWPRPDTVVFTPQTDYQRRQTYRVQIGDTAASANGLTLDVPLELMLQTVGALEVSQIIPSDGSADVQTDGAITVLFNRPVVPLVSSGQQADLPQPLIFDPPVSGQGEWTSTSIYRFVPDEPLAGATTYRLSLDEELTDVVGVSLERPFNSQFTTLNPDIVTIQPDSSADLVPTVPITITFNMPMDRATTETALSLSGLDAPDASFAFEWLENDRVVQLTPEEPLALDTAYQLQISGSARAANGEASLGDTETVTYQTVPFPGIVRTVPASGGVPERFQRGVVIQFASPMNWETVEGNIRIDPEPARINSYVNQFSNEISLDFNLELNTVYTIIVPGFVADPYGNTLGEPYTFRFTTQGRVPIASLGLPPRLSQFSTSFSTNVDVIHVNVSRLDLALYELGLPLNLLNQPYDVTDYRPAAAPLRTWSLPQSSPHDEVGTLTVPLAGESGGTLAPGVYLLTVDAPETDEEVRFWQNQRTLLVVADANIVVKEMFGAVHVWVTDLQTGQPASGQSLTLYSEQGVSLGTAVSDNNGFAQFEYNPTNGYLEGVTVVSSQPGQAGFGIGSSIWDQGAMPWAFNIPANSGAEIETLAYIYTDRPIYRPGDTLYFKGIVRDTNYGRYTLPTLANLDLRLSSNNFFGGETFERTIPVTVAPDGSFSGEYQLPQDLSLGSFQLFVQSSTVEAFRQFTVAEYRAPEFLVSMVPTEPEQLRGESVTVELSAEYFFGGPATDLPVEWTVYEQAFQPTPEGGPYYSFGDAGGFLYEDAGLFGGFGGGGAGFGNFLFNGNGRTDENGRLLITLPANFLQDVDAGSRVITVEANVLDLSEFAVTSRAQVTLHAAETYVGIQPDDFIGRAGTESTVNLETIDWDGRSVANQEVEVIFYRREWVPNRTQDYGVYYTSWDTVDTEVARTRVTTDAQGRAAASFTPDEGGSYIAVATVTDDGGREQFSSTSIWVIDSGQIGWQIDPRDKTMELIPDATGYAPGDTARVLVQSPFAEPVQAWLTIERGQLLEQQVITINGSSDVLEIPITAAMAPNAFVTITAIKGVTDGSSPYPEMRLGIAQLSVSVEQQTLTVTLTPQQETLAPGDTAVYTISVTDYQGNPVQADVSLALVDLAVLTLKEDNAPNIVDAFYAEQPYRSRLGSGLLFSGEGYPLEIPVEQLGLGGGGGGEAVDSALARSVGGDEDGVRQDFPDTAFWQASLTTDANGQAIVEIPLPDNLTTWRLSSKAVTPDTLVGQSSVDIVTTLPLLVRPVTPRFFTAGDVVELGAIVNNNTGAELETAVTLEATGVTLNGLETQTVTVPANGQMLVRWPVTVENVAGVDLTFRVEGSEYSDASKPTFGDSGAAIPVYRYTGDDVVATAGQLDEAGNRVEAILLPPGVDPAQGEVAISLSPSLAAALVDSIDLNNELDYSSLCAYAVTDRLLPNAALLGLAQRLPAASLDAADVAESETIVQTSVSQLEELVLADGGWGWCSSGESDPWLTAYALFGLAQARELGYTARASILENAANYLVAQLVTPSPQVTAYEVNRQAFFLYVLAQLDADIVPDLDRLVEENRSLLDPYARALVASAYADLGVTDDRVATLLNDLNDSAVVSATGTHWQDASRDIRNLNSDVRGTAVVLQTLAQLDPENPLLPGAVRWLMSSRTAQLWATSHETAWTIFSLTEWMAATGELEANYEYNLDVNLQPVTDGRFTTSTVTDSRNISLPISELLLEDANFFNFGRGAGDGRLYYTMHLESAIDMNFVSPVNRGVSVERVYYDAACDPETETCEPITEIEAGQQVRVVLTIIAENDLVYAMVEDPIPAGTEAIDPGLNTNSPTQGGEVTQVDEEYRYGYWGWWFFNQIEYQDEQVVFLANFLPAGTYQYSYFLQATIPGEYQVRPTFARQTFFPEVNGRSAGLVFTITR